jgi:hypothetical protein
MTRAANREVTASLSSRCYRFGPGVVALIVGAVG